jgi:two-component system, chemotaxis family, chemotaxis protein CheY
MAKRVLVVDDAMIMRMRIKDIAKEAGWEIAGEAADGAEALLRYKELQPDLITMDIVMPNMDGVSALRQLKQECPEARVVMVSAVDQREKLTECIRLGVVDFIVKPFDKIRLKGFFEKYGRDQEPGVRSQRSEVRNQEAPRNDPDS